MTRLFCLTTITDMKVYAILTYAEDYEIVIDKIFSSRKKARKYIHEKYYTNCDIKDDKTLKNVDGWIDEKELE